MPVLQAGQDSTGQNIRVVLVSSEPRDTVRQVIKEKEYSTPVYVSDDLSPVLEDRGVPRTYVLRPDGQVVYRHVGPTDWDTEPVHGFLNRR